ncbi:MAG: metallophosphatase family protein [Planctomycetaceae bacterium]|nr:metallophosphatase family protein [Planctomycetaceae bacterium]
MRFAIFGDIHGNLEALEAVLAECGNHDVDQYLCLGDIVGYGANPNECVERIRSVGALAVCGNHDHAVIGAQNLNYFNAHARDAVIWTAKQLSTESKQWLRGLSLVEHLPDFSIVHGSLHSPELFNYVQTIKDADYNFRQMDRPLLFLGHSHYPLAFFDTAPMTYTLDPVIPLDLSVKTVVNAGSVGQPRDEDPRLCFVIYDDEASLVELLRVEYDIETAARKILEAGLPQTLALRLTLGK